MNPVSFRRRDQQISILGEPMPSRLLPRLASLLLCLLLAACAAQKEPPQHKTWVDLNEISSHVTQNKKEHASQQLEDDKKRAAREAEQNNVPRTRDLSSATDATNSYLRDLKGAKPTPQGKEIEGEGVMLNFDNADIYEVIQVIGEALNLSYIIDPQVKGVVNIRSGHKIPKNELFTVFKKILNINGLDIRNEGDHYYIFVAAKPSSLAVYDKDQIGKLTPSSKVVTQVVPVLHIASSEAQKLIEPYLSQQAVIYNLADLNTLVISDFEAQVIDALNILSRLDVSALSSMRIKVVRVEKAPLFDLADELKEVLLALKINKKDYEGVQMLPLERVNSIMLIGYDDSLVQTAVKWVEELDRAPSGGRDSIYIYNVHNSVASELVDLVGSLIGEKGAGGAGGKKTGFGKKRGISTTPGAVRPPGTLPTTTQPGQAGQTPGFGTPGAAKSPVVVGSQTSMQFAGEPSLIADDTRNIVLIRARFADYQRILKLLERLDNMPTQVLIEVIVAEVTLNKDLEYGVEWALKKGQLRANGAAFTYGLPISGGGNSGFQGGISIDANQIFNFLNVLASDTDVKVISSPQVLVLNNESATVNVGKQVPVVTSQITDINNSAVTSSTLTTAANQTVQYKDTGVILNVTPRINSEGIILLDIDQQVSSVDSAVTGGVNSPTISTKEVKTKLAVKDGQSILIGGMISKNGSDTDSGVPILKDIPGLGWLFKQKSRQNSKTELLLTVTPYVIESEDVLDQYIQGFKEKVDGLRHDLEK